jgi:beta-N-acetylhexosaminidase
MVSWATYPALDRYAPAGMSPAVVQGELRGRLGFQGVTITDGLGAGALYAYGGFAHRAVSASRAGADLLLCSTPSSAGNSPANGVAALNGLVAGFEDGAVSRTTAEASVARIIALRTSP